MAAGNRLKAVREEIALIERILPLLKLLLAVLRTKRERYEQRALALAREAESLDLAWTELQVVPLARTLDAAVSARPITRPKRIVNAVVAEIEDIDIQRALDDHIVCASDHALRLFRQVVERHGTLARLRVEEENVRSLRTAEQRISILVNGNEHTKLPALREELAFLRRRMDEENAMAAAVARRIRDQQKTDEEVQVWPLCT